MSFKKMMFSIFLCFNMWALSDRALFSINDQVVFASRADEYLSILDKNTCKSELNLIYELLELESTKKRVGVILDGSLDQKVFLNKTLSLFKLLHLSSSQKEKMSQKDIGSQCSIKTENQKMKLLELKSANEFIKQRLSTFTKNDEDALKQSMRIFSQSFLDSMEARLYY